MHLDENVSFSTYPIYILNITFILSLFVLSFYIDLYTIEAVVVAIIIVISLFFFAIRKPEIAVLLTFSASLMGPLGSIFSSDTTMIPLTMFQIAFLFTILVIMANPKLFFERIYSPNKIILYFFFFSIFLLIYSLISLDPSRALYNIITFWFLLIFASLVYYFYQDKKIFKQTFTILLIVTVILSLFSLYLTIKNPQAILMNALNSQSKVFGRQVGLWEDPNDFGLILVFPILYLISKTFIYKSFSSKLEMSALLVSFVFILLALLTTYSRSAWLALSVSTVYLFIYTKRTKRLIILLSFLLILFSIFVLTNESFFLILKNRIVSIIDITKNTSNMGRIVLAKAAIDMFYDSGFLGIGYMSFASLAPSYFNPVLTQGVVESHNLTLTLLAETGIIGVSIFYGIFLGLFKSTKSAIERLTTDEKIYFLTFRSYIIAILMFYQFYPGALHFNFLWFSIGALLALTPNGGRKSSATSPLLHELTE